MEERRKFKRFKSPFCVQCVDKESCREFPGVLKDISYGGARVQLYTALDIAKSQEVSLSILLPDTTLKVCAKVSWMSNDKDKREVGVCFAYLCDDDKEAIYNNIFKYFRKELTQKWWNA
jgi:c-di-GMP-binding flagellar brake protein YcgR